MAQPPPTSPSQQPPATVLHPTKEGIARAAKLLQQGKLVILPTETVYGIALNLLHDDAREAARAIKARASEGAAQAPTPWVVHVAQPEELLSWVPSISALGRRLITKSLPGPVAFQIKLDPGSESAARHRLQKAADETIQSGYITLRCPEFLATQEVLVAVGSPVAIMGAGTRSQPGVYELSDLPPTSEDGPSAPQTALDGGPTRYRRASTLVRIDPGGYSVVRAGVIDERILQKLADFTLLFLCSGNTCRSPMAASIAAKTLADKLGIAVSELPLRHIVVQSAGLHASRGMRATMEAVDAVKGIGADLSSHFSQPATADLLRRADVIYTMTAAHRDEVLELVPGAERKTFRIDPEGDVADPIGSALPVYQRVARRLASVIEERLSELAI